MADCHGRPDLIENALSHAEYNINRDHLIFAGDIVDVGDHPYECLSLLVDSEAELLWGNHDVAALYGLKIWPYNIASEEFMELLRKYEHELKLATHFKGVLITHAGLSINRYIEVVNTIADDNISANIVDVVSSLNNTTILREYKNRDGVLWYRPSKSNVWHTRVKQVVGHTPPEYVKRCMDPWPLNKFYVVDPYSGNGFGDDRYRYAIIDDNGNVMIADSNGDE